jgi:hypothetical protein
MQRKVFIWAGLFVFFMSGCMNFEKNTEKTPVSSVQMMSSYSPALKECLRKCDIKYSLLDSVNNDDLRKCACNCHTQHGSKEKVSNYCQENQGGLIQSSDADTLTDLKPKSGL